MNEKFLSVAAMNLRAWQTHKGVRTIQLAPQLGVSVNTVMKYRTGRARPLDGVRLVIERVTDGAVRPGDWSVRYEG